MTMTLPDGSAVEPVRVSTDDIIRFMGVDERALDIPGLELEDSTSEVGPSFSDDDIPSDYSTLTLICCVGLCLLGGLVLILVIFLLVRRRKRES